VSSALGRRAGGEGLVNNVQPGERYWRLIEPVWAVTDIYAEWSHFQPQFVRLTVKQAYLFAAHWCQSEVRNGGFFQFYSNPTGILAPEAATGLRAIGLWKCAAVVEETLAFFGASYPREQAARVERLERVIGENWDERDPFSLLNERFYSLLDTEAGGFLRAADRYAEPDAA